ncbi:FK506 binding protein proline rotamase rapamycin-binding protein [Ciborinia camelliae]|nr:FK506 binding protein proline rotamase rapamycin-binding protein [Ciborinia camelliae]
MGVTKTVLNEGTGAIPKVGDTVTIQYTGWLKDVEKGTTLDAQKVTPPFDSSVGRGPFIVQIGVGQVIKGWDEGVTTMKVGEKATLDITPDYAYGARLNTPDLQAPEDQLNPRHVAKFSPLDRRNDEEAQAHDE